MSVTEITRPDLFPLDTNQTQSAVLGQITEEHSYTVRRKESNVIADVSGEASVENEMAETLNRELHAGDVTLQKQGGIRTRKAKGLQPGERDLLCLLDRDMVDSILCDIDTEDDIDDFENNTIKLANVLLDK